MAKPRLLSEKEKAELPVRGWENFPLTDIENCKLDYVLFYQPTHIYECTERTYYYYKSTIHGLCMKFNGKFYIG